jgi:RNA ligase (TIGR02306 family)
MTIARKLASVQRITEITPVENADTLVKMQILGWQVVGKKGDFKEGDLCIFFEIDSILPDIPIFEFMRPRRFKVKTIKLRGEMSQGLAMPLSIINEIDPGTDERGVQNPSLCGDELYEGLDLTNYIGVIKREDIVKLHIQGAPRSTFPTHLIPKTDEIRIQQVPHIMQEFLGRLVYVTEKLDGTSGTFIMAGEFLVCSRNQSLYEDNDNLYWRIASMYNLRDKLALVKYYTGKSYAIQGEIVGPGVNGNPYKLTRVKLAVFQVYDLDERRFLDLADWLGFCDLLDLENVPPIWSIEMLVREVGTVSKWLDLCSQLQLDYVHEGIVIRPVVECYSYQLRGRLSVKIVNNDYLMKSGG